MKELQEILKRIEQFEKDEKAVLATVVDVKGSSYRLPGARMLILESGETQGTVSGGCLEADVLARAKKVLLTGTPQIFTYDTTAVEDSIFSLNMGCRGVIRILLEAVGNGSSLFQVLQATTRERKKQFVATLISSSKDSLVGGRIFYGDAQQFRFQNLPRSLENAPEVLNDCTEFFESERQAEARLYKIEENVFELFFENVNPPLNLLIFGAGADAIPLAEIAKILGWRVCVIDHRPAFACAERFPSAEEIMLLRPENLSENLPVDDNAVAVVMTHNYEHDKQILKFLLASKTRYVGALGPKRRTENLLAELRDAGKNFAPSQLEKLFAPVGLDIGANAPEAIALSIVAEIQSFTANRAGGFLRERRGSIYDRDKQSN